MPNDRLAALRGESVVALLNGDRDKWVAVAAKDGAPSDVQRLLTYYATAYGWNANPGRTDGVVDDGMRSAVVEFQRMFQEVFEKSLDDDGVVGVKTLGAMFDVQFHELEVQLSNIGVERDDLAALASGAAQNAESDLVDFAPIKDSFSPEGQRRVDLLLIEEPNGWAQPHGIQTLYRAARWHEIELAPQTANPAELVLQLVDHYARPMPSTWYRLRTSDEVREGTTDQEGFLRESNLRGNAPRIELEGGALILFDQPYRESSEKRLTPGTAAVDVEDEELDPDGPLPGSFEPDPLGFLDDDDGEDDDDEGEDDEGEDDDG